MTHTLLVTGSSGLIGSEVVSYFAPPGWSEVGVNNNQRADFFGPQGDTFRMRGWMGVNEYPHQVGIIYKLRPPPAWLAKAASA